MSKNKISEWLQMASKAAEQFDLSKLVNDVKKNVTEKTEDFQSNLKKERDEVVQKMEQQVNSTEIIPNEPDVSNKRNKLNELIQNAKNEHKDDASTLKEENTKTIRESGWSEKVVEAYKAIEKQISNLSKNEMVKIIIGLSNSKKEQNELNSLSNAAVREVLLGLIIYLFKIGKHKFIFATIASLIGMKIYQYFKNDSDNKEKAKTDNEAKKLEDDNSKNME